ncbi:AraC family transcriptional regulator [Brucella intermedia]|uniref:AraC family transcriptional regulator n=1 Tax=Brucella intermedia TaxID=94625 RepID=UPI00224AD55F|nr:AraC family transcriptional regulator [Brucella intermedia]
MLKPRTAISAGLNAGGEWAIRFPAHEGVKFNTVLWGSCWVQVDGEAEPLRIEAGDCFLLTRGRPFLFATDMAVPAIASATIYDKASDGIAICNGGGDFFLIGGRFSFDGDRADLLFGAMPAIVHVRDASNHATVLRWSLEQLATELKHELPGGTLMADHLAQIMLLQVIRRWLNSDTEKPAGWLRALTDPRLSRVMAAMHGEPARRWTLSQSAGLAGMSRTVFVGRFRDVVGATPLNYLLGWRMQLAAYRLQNSGESVANIGISVGYESEAAFSTAFRRMVGCTPMQHRRLSGSKHRHPIGD